MERLEELKKCIEKINKDNDWNQFYSLVNLAKSISIETNELLFTNVDGIRISSRYYE